MLDVPLSLSLSHSFCFALLCLALPYTALFCPARPPLPSALCPLPSALAAKDPNVVGQRRQKITPDHSKKRHP